MPLANDVFHAHTLVFPRRNRGSAGALTPRFCLHVDVRPGVTVAEISGEIDACNAGQLQSRIGGLIADGRKIVLDFSGVGFLGMAGFRALESIGEQCAQHGVRWAMVGGHAVDLVLRVADRDRRLPATTSRAAALELLRPPKRSAGSSQQITPVAHTRC